MQIVQSFGANMRKSSNIKDLGNKKPARKKSAIYQTNKDENVHKFALSAIRGKLLEREREKIRDIVLEYFTRVTYYPQQRLKERDRKRKREGERERKKKREEREREKEKERGKIGKRKREERGRGKGEERERKLMLKLYEHDY